MAPTHEKLTGLVAATFTPFTKEGDIDLSVIGDYVDYLKEKQGVKNIFVNGTTGESMSLTVEERKKLVETWCKEAKGKMDQVIVHVGCMSLKDSQDLARHAAQLGVDGIAVISPSFFKPRNADALTMYLKEVSKAAPGVPFYYYHLPAFTGVDVLAIDVLEGIKHSIPSYSGVKFSSTDLMDFGLCVSQSQDKSVLYGVDEQLLAALAMGASGAVGSTYNYMGRIMNNLLSEFGNGSLNKARETQFKMQEFLRYAKNFNFDLGVNKQLMIVLSGLQLGPPRLPVMPCSPSDAEKIAEEFRRIFPES
ncbi:N-acetylneuraminate lyase [Trachinotus anak]|uniref:N-acetylneuraminate lyase n=1 Tax=Trachinotus anak TaxID=443729 RepID=UPI0039F1E548